MPNVNLNIKKTDTFSLYQSPVWSLTSNMTINYNIQGVFLYYWDKTVFLPQIHWKYTHIQCEGFIPEFLLAQSPCAASADFPDRLPRPLTFNPVLLCALFSTRLAGPRPPSQPVTVPNIPSSVYLLPSISVPSRHPRKRFHHLWPNPSFNDVRTLQGPPAPSCALHKAPCTVCVCLWVCPCHEWNSRVLHCEIDQICISVYSWFFPCVLTPCTSGDLEPVSDCEEGLAKTSNVPVKTYGPVGDEATCRWTSEGCIKIIRN